MIVDRRLHSALGIAALLLTACGPQADKAADAAVPANSRAAPPATDAAPAATGPTESLPLPPTAGTKLAIYVGKYPSDKVDGVAWNDHLIVKAGIAATVKDPTVLKAITTTGGPSAPIEMKDGKVMAWACEAHHCGLHQWAVLVDPRTGATDVCYYNKASDPANARWFLATGTEERRAGNCQSNE